jgi:dihydroflavonol-4-reductase
VVSALADVGVEVVALDRAPPLDEQLPRRTRFVRGDVLDPGAVQRAVEPCDVVFHLAAVYSYVRGDAGQMQVVNVRGTQVVLEAALRGRRRRVVRTSSCATCGPVPGRSATEQDHPSARDLRIPYRRTKLEGERLALRAAREGAEVVVVNPTTPVGPGDLRPTPTGKMVADVASGRARGYLARSALNIVAVEDVARGHVLALERGRPRERYLLGGENLGVRDVFATVARAAGVAVPRVPVPWSAACAAAWVADHALRPLGCEPRVLVLDEVRAGRLPHLFDDSKARAELGYTSIPATDALAGAVLAALAAGAQYG